MARTTNFDENFYSFQHTIEARDFIENIFQLKEIFEFGPHSQKQITEFDNEMIFANKDSRYLDIQRDR